MTGFLYTGLRLVGIFWGVGGGVVLVFNFEYQFSGEEQYICTGAVVQCGLGNNLCSGSLGEAWTVGLDLSAGSAVRSKYATLSSLRQARTGRDASAAKAELLGSFRVCPESLRVSFFLKNLQNSQ